MAFKLSSFCRDTGPELIADYLRSVLNEGFPASGVPRKPRDRARFLCDLIDGLPDDKNRRAVGDFRRVELLSGPAGQESLRQCLDPGDWSRRVCSHKSARQRALFCWLRRRDAFLTAEFRQEHKLKRQSLRDAASFDSLPGHDSGTLDLDPASKEAFSALLKVALTDHIRRGTDFAFLTTTVWSDVGKTPEKVYQLGIRWIDGSVGQFQPQRDGASYNMTDVSQTITVTYVPSSGRIIVTGKKLEDEVFEALADMFAARVLGTPHKPRHAPGDVIMPENFLPNRQLKLPSRLDADRAGFQRITLLLPTSRQPVPLPLEPNPPIARSVARHLTEAFSCGVFPLSEVRTIRLEVHLTPDALTGKARSFRMDVSSTGLKVSSALDKDLLFAEVLLELNGVLVRAKDAPLLARAG